MANLAPSFTLVAHTASPEEAAAVVAGLERFIRATAPAPASASPRGADAWRETALLEAVQRDRHEDLADPWINT